MDSWYCNDNANDLKIFPNSKFDLAWLQTTLQRCFDTKWQLKGAKYRRIGCNEGVWSVVIGVECQWILEKQDSLSTKDRCQQQPPERLVMKFPTLSTIRNMHEHFDIPKGPSTVAELIDRIGPDVMSKMHKGEMEFYRMIHDDEIQKRLKLPKVYLFQNTNDSIVGTFDGVIIMEDLSETASVKPLGAGLNLNACFQVVEALVDLHIWFYANKSKWIENMAMRNTVGGLVYGKDHLASLTEATKKLLIEEDWTGVEFDGLAERLGDLDPDFQEQSFPKTISSIYGIEPILTHGDLVSNNLLFAFDKHKNVSDRLVAVIDWQTCHPGSAAEDLCRLLCNSATTTTRRQHTTDILRKYYDTLSQRMGTKPDYSFDQLKSMFRDLFPFSAATVARLSPKWAKPKRLKSEDRMGRVASVMERLRSVLVDAYDIVDDKVAYFERD